MYQPVLGRFLSRDPLPPEGQPDILYDNNWFGDRMTRMRNTYGYVANDPVNQDDPSGLQARRKRPPAPRPAPKPAPTIPNPYVDAHVKFVSCGNMNATVIYKCLGKAAVALPAIFQFIFLVPLSENVCCACAPNNATAFKKCVAGYLTFYLGVYPFCYVDVA